MATDINLNLNVSVDQVVSSLNQDELYKFICELDDKVAELDFTEKLAKHFSKIVEEES